MKSFGIVGGIISVITVMLLIYSSIDRKIEDKLNDPRFIRKVAEEVRLPFVIFDDKDVISVDTGAMKYIDKIEINKNKDQILSEVVVSPKSFMALPPILESLDDKEIEFEEPQRGTKFNLIYNTVKYDGVGWGTSLAPGSKPQRRFRLQLVALPEQ
ncbi:MAG: hypothetical protein C4526_09900 [Nitrospiraceae bacterium]|nr:MAG: hypothetical protein C4526_09900 [Nitrospiraceae bacterium]